MSTIEQTLLRLQKSAFRAKFHLSEKDRQYIMDKGMGTIQHHAADFIRMRLAPAIIPNDGKQTPMRGHPVFIAQHACACCCRSCLNKWYHVPIGRELTEDAESAVRSDTAISVHSGIASNSQVSPFSRLGKKLCMAVEAFPSSST